MNAEDTYEKTTVKSVRRKAPRSKSKPLMQYKHCALIICGGTRCFFYNTFMVNIFNAIRYHSKEYIDHNVMETTNILWRRIWLKHTFCQL